MGRGDSRNPSSLIPYAMGFALFYPSYSSVKTRGSGLAKLHYPDKVRKQACDLLDCPPGSLFWVVPFISFSIFLLQDDAKEPIFQQDQKNYTRPFYWPQN
jgi:hypothetical protein